MLHFDQYKGKTDIQLVILHGLFGSAKNFASIATDLTDLANIYAYDARNHGRSTHTATHTLSDLTADLFLFLREHNIERPVLVGHSMGGLTAMNFARVYPELPHALVIVDIAPRTYPPAHSAEIAAQKMDLGHYSNRRQLDDAMAKILPNGAVRSFLQMNVDRDANGVFYWINNIQAIENSPERTVFPVFDPPIFLGPVLAVRGLASDYVTEQDVLLMQSAFPFSTLKSISGAGHWLHHTHREILLQHIRAFLLEKVK